MQQAQVREQVDHLLLAEVAATGRAIRGQAGRAQLLLVPFRVGSRGEQEDDLAGARGAALDELPNPPRDMPRFCAPPVQAAVGVGRLVGDQQLDRGAEDRVEEVSRGGELLELVAELGREEVVDDAEHLRPRAVVARQRQQRLGGSPPFAKHLHIRVPEAVDRLELVADEEDLGSRPGQQIHEVALQAVRVLELVDHDRAEAELFPLAQVGTLLQELARTQLQILEVESRLAVLRLVVRFGEPAQKLLEELAIAEGELVERRLLDRLARLLVARGPLALRAQAAQIEQSLVGLRGARQADRLRGGSARELCRLRIVREALRRLGQLRQTSVETRSHPELELERAPGRAQRLVDARQHPPQAGSAVGREKLQPLRLLRGAEQSQSGFERLAADDPALALVEHAEARVEPGREWMRLQEPQAEAVDRGDPGAVEGAREVVPAELGESRPDPAAELACRALGVGDHEQGLDVEPAVADRLHEALDEHRRLAGAGARGDEDATPSRNRRLLLLVCQLAHARLIRHIRQRSHQAGHSPPFGSCRTSPSWIRCASPRARSRAPSTRPQKASSSR